MSICKNLFLEGKTDKQVAQILDVTEQTINNWKNAQPHFFESLKDWKIIADEKVEKSLYERACGYTCKETKVASHEGLIIDKVEIDKNYPPDPVSMIFWLKNRKPDEWRDKQDISFDISNVPNEELVKMGIDAARMIRENNNKKNE